MPTGIEIKSATSGSFMLDANQANPSLVSSGTIATVANTSTQLGASQFTISHTATGFAPICVIRPPVGAASWQFYSVSSAGTYTWRFISVGAIGTQIPYWIFATPTSSENFGLEVFDSSGSRVFHSGRYPLRIITPVIGSNVTVNGLGATNTPETFTFASGRTYGAFFGRPSGFRVYSPAGRGNYNLRGYFNGFQGATDGITTLNIAHSSVGPTSTPDYGLERYWLERLIIPVDVTNYV